MIEQALQENGGFTPEELEEQEILELPDREMLSIVVMSPLPLPTAAATAAAKAAPAALGAEQAAAIDQPTA